MKKKLIFMLMAIWIGLSPAMAQKGFNINSLFNGYYHNKKNATETVLKGSRLDEYNLDVYHSLVVTGNEAEANKIEKLVLKDGTKAKQKEQTFRNGHLYYGFYQFGHTDLNYYIFYLNKFLNSGNSVTLIYMEGEATRWDIDKMLK